VSLAEEPQVQAPKAEDTKVDWQEAAKYLGRWNLLILEPGDVFPSSWLKLQAMDGSLRSELVWKWGSNTPIEKIAIDAAGLKFARGDETYEAKVDGNEIRGKARMGDGKVFDFRGRRAQEMCEVAGAWKVTADIDPEKKVSVLRFEVRDGKIEGSAVDPQGLTFDVRDAKLAGNVLEFVAVLRDRPEIRGTARCEVRGDVLVGRVEVVPPGQSEKRTIDFRGTRDRKWGAPVALLAKEGLEGWKRRNPATKSGWKVTDGILENGDNDCDIMSETKFRDFKLHLEYKVAKRCNSGIYLRGRYELQIVGSTELESHGNMAVYSRLSPVTNNMKDFDEWQVVDVTFVGRWLTVVFNGEVVHDNAYLDGITGGATDPWEEEPGPLNLQGDHGKILFRNVVVTPAE
jgi:hypothetical protein